MSSISSSPAGSWIPYNSRYHRVFRNICGENPSEETKRFERFVQAYTCFDQSGEYPPARQIRIGRQWRAGGVIGKEGKGSRVAQFREWLENDNCPPPPGGSAVREPVGSRAPVRPAQRFARVNSPSLEPSLTCGFWCEAGALFLLAAAGTALIARSAVGFGARLVFGW